MVEDGLYGRLGLGDAGAAGGLDAGAAGGVCGIARHAGGDGGGQAVGVGPRSARSTGPQRRQGRLVPTRMEPQHFAHASISAVAAGGSHSGGQVICTRLYNAKDLEGGNAERNGVNN